MVADSARPVIGVDVLRTACILPGSAPGCAELRMTFTAAAGSTGGIGGRRWVSRRRTRCVAESGPGAQARIISEAIFLVAQRPSDLSCAGASQDGVGNGLHVSRVGAAAATEDGDLWVLCPQLHVIAG